MAAHTFVVELVDDESGNTSIKCVPYSSPEEAVTAVFTDGRRTQADLDKRVRIITGNLLEITGIQVTASVTCGGKPINVPLP